MVLYINGFVDNNEENIILVSNEEIVQSGGSVSLWAFVRDSNKIPVGGQEIYFFEQYIPYTLRLSVSPTVFQTGDTVNLSSVLKDEDGSLVEGETVDYYLEKDNGLAFSDSTEHSKTASGYDNFALINDDLYFTGLEDFDLSFKFKTTGECRFIIGDLDSMTVSHPSSSLNPNYCMYIGTNSSLKLEWGYRTTNTTYGQGGTLSSDTYYTGRIVKNGNEISYYFDGVLKDTLTINWFGSVEKFSLGMVVWNDDNITVKDIVFKVMSDG